MAKARGRSGGSTESKSEPRKSEPAPEDNAAALEAAPEPVLPEPAPAKSPSTVSLVQELPDRTPRVTIQSFVRGTKDPILRSFASQERLTQAARKLTRDEWKTAFEAFKSEPR
jgi:hypothetical protein